MQQDLQVGLPPVPKYNTDIIEARYRLLRVDSAGGSELCDFLGNGRVSFVLGPITFFWTTPMPYVSRCGCHR